MFEYVQFPMFFLRNDSLLNNQHKIESHVHLSNTASIWVIQTYTDIAEKTVHYLNAALWSTVLTLRGMIWTLNGKFGKKGLMT